MSSSPFHESPGQHKFGDRLFEWRSLLDTPCYGFSGPNACYSSTCNHGAPISTEPEKKSIKSKLSNSSKSLFKFHLNAKKSSNCERVTDDNPFKSSLTKYSSVHMNARGYSRKNPYVEYEQTFNG